MVDWYGNNNILEKWFSWEGETGPIFAIHSRLATAKTIKFSLFKPNNDLHLFIPHDRTYILQKK